MSIFVPQNNKKNKFLFCTSMIDFPEDKNELKKVYQNIKGKALNG